MTNEQLAIYLEEIRSSLDIAQDLIRAALEGDKKYEKVVKNMFNQDVSQIDILDPIIDLEGRLSSSILTLKGAK